MITFLYCHKVVTSDTASHRIYRTRGPLPKQGAPINLKACVWLVLTNYLSHPAVELGLGLELGQQCLVDVHSIRPAQINWIYRLFDC